MILYEQLSKMVIDDVAHQQLSQLLFVDSCRIHCCFVVLALASTCSVVAR